MKVFKQYSIVFLFIISGVFLLNACENSTGSEDHDDHHDPFGVAMILNGVEIAVQENGNISYHDGSHLELEVGEETEIILIRWIGENGDRFEADTDDGYSLRWIVDNEDVLDVEQHETDDPWGFHLVGKSAGETTIELQLWHNDHADFTSQKFEVHVESAISSSQITDENGTVLVQLDEDGTVTGDLSVNAGETTGTYIIHLFDHDGGNISPYTDDFDVHVHTDDEEVATAESFIFDEGRYGFTITGVSSGTTSVHFEIIGEHHDDHDHEHADDDDDEEELIIYESPEIDVHVN